MEIDTVTFLSAADLVKVALEKIEKTSCEDGLSGIPTGFYKLDIITDGWQPSDLIVIAANTSMGKSAFGLSILRNASVDFGISVLMFSPEMSSIQIMNRLMSSETGLSLSKFRNGKFEKHEWELLAIKAKSLKDAPFYIDDSPNLSIQKLSELSREYVNQREVRLILVDNIHLISSGIPEKSTITREQEISVIMRNLKALAKELHIPIIAISQLSRINESRGNYKRPILSDLRGSGTIEEIADIVSFIYRPEYYKIEEWDDEEASPTQGQAEFIIAKHRNGSLENVRLKFIGHLGKFDNLDECDDSFDDFSGKINYEDNPFLTKNLPSANEAFGSQINPPSSNDDDVPF